VGEGGRGELSRAGRCRCPDLRRGGSHRRRGLGAEVDVGAGVARRVALEFGPSENSLLLEDQVMSVDRM